MSKVKNFVWTLASRHVSDASEDDKSQVSETDGLVYGESTKEGRSLDSVSWGYSGSPGIFPPLFFLVACLKDEDLKIKPQHHHRH